LKVGFGIGLLLCFLIPIALLLFSVVSVAQTASLVFLLAGLWAVVFGLAFASRKDRLYQIGFGIVVAVLSTFIVLPLQYTAGLVVLSVIGVALASIAERPKASQQMH
jgi:predicted membrane channel-forming protein YqfA (hemolysin III family)